MTSRSRAVTRAPEENLRAAPGGALVAKLPHGFLLSKVGAQRRWMHVQRTGWMPRAALEVVADTGAATPGRRPEDSLPPHADGAGAQPGRRATLYRAPDGPAAGTLAPSTPLRVLSRSGDWTRVQVEAWVKTADLSAAAPGVLVGVSAAELRADPERYLGQTLGWTLQYIAQEKADELRPEMPAGATYLLARGPLPERGFVYVVVPEAKRALVASLAPLTVIHVTARVRAGRTRYLGNPVVDLLSLEVQSKP